MYPKIKKPKIADLTVLKNPGDIYCIQVPLSYVAIVQPVVSLRKKIDL